ncbi:MAG: hypothetical protein ACJA07_001467 [Rhodococcus sp. (in: high G+C Gram-positive bacteria)]
MVTARSRAPHLSIATPVAFVEPVHVTDIADLPAVQADIIDTLTRIGCASLGQVTIPTATESTKDKARAVAALADCGLVRIWQHPVDQRTLLVELASEANIDRPRQVGVVSPVSGGRRWVC